jgi:hypothetical protein
VTLSQRQFGWDHVSRNMPDDDKMMAEDYVHDLAGKPVHEVSWRYGTHPVEPGLASGSEDSGRRSPGHIESLRAPVRVGRTPPILVVHGTVVDGFHRLKAAARNGQPTVEAWHGE